jgi:hypothetical protein
MSVVYALLTWESSDGEPMTITLLEDLS